MELVLWKKCQWNPETSNEKQRRYRFAMEVVKYCFLNIWIYHDLLSLSVYPYFQDWNHFLAYQKGRTLFTNLTNFFLFLFFLGLCITFRNAIPWKRSRLLNVYSQTDQLQNNNIWGSLVLSIFFHWVFFTSRLTYLIYYNFVLSSNFDYKYYTNIFNSKK